MGLGRDAIKFATRRSAGLAANAKGDWKKIAAFGAAAAIVFVVAAFGYAGLSKVRKGDEQPDDDKPDDEQPDPGQSREPA